MIGIGLEKLNKMAKETKVTLEDLMEEKRLVEEHVTDILRQFEARFGIEVEYINFDDNDLSWIEKHTKKKKSQKKSFKMEIEVK